MSAIISQFKTREKIYEDNGATGYLLSKNDINEYVMLEIEPSGFIPTHALPIDVDFFVIKGNGLAILGDEEKLVEEGDTIQTKANVQRGWKNDTLDMLQILAIKHL